MGQYYNIIIQKRGEERIRAYDRHIDGEYTMAKLMEHSYYLNDMVNAVAEKLYNQPSRIAWVGDYAEPDIDPKLYKAAWKRSKYGMLHYTPFNLSGLFLVNHSKKLILDCWKYLLKCAREGKDEWIIHPLPLLTAIGNGRGGGDYRGTNQEAVGSWAWDELEIVEFKRAVELKGERGYESYHVTFIER